MPVSQLPLTQIIAMRFPIKKERFRPFKFFLGSIVLNDSYCGFNSIQPFALVTEVMGQASEDLLRGSLPESKQGHFFLAKVDQFSILKHDIRSRQLTIVSKYLGQILSFFQTDTKLYCDDICIASAKLTHAFDPNTI